MCVYGVTHGVYGVADGVLRNLFRRRRRAPSFSSLNPSIPQSLNPPPCLTARLSYYVKRVGRASPDNSDTPGRSM